MEEAETEILHMMVRKQSSGPVEVDRPFNSIQTTWLLPEGEEGQAWVAAAIQAPMAGVAAEVSQDFWLITQVLPLLEHKQLAA